MLIKSRKKNTGNKQKINFFKKIFLCFKNFSFILILIQLFIFLLIGIFYQSSQLSKSYPPKLLLEKFDQLVSPIIDKIFNNCLLNNTLSELRHLLLPNIISGKLKISDVEDYINSENI